MNQENTKDFDLEEALLKKGVPKEHIEKMKIEKPMVTSETYYHTALMQKNENGKDVPYYEEKIIEVSKITMSGRLNSNYSFFDAANSFSNGLADKINVNTSKFDDNIENLNKYTYSELEKHYEEIKPIDVFYYEGLDMYKVDDGTHRFLFAKVAGLKHINAKVRPCVVSDKKYKSYQIVQNLIKKYNIYGTLKPYYNKYKYCNVFKHNDIIYYIDNYDDISMLDLEKIDKYLLLQKQLEEDFYWVNKLEKYFSKGKASFWGKRKLKKLENQNYDCYSRVYQHLYHRNKILKPCISEKDTFYKIF